MTFTGGSEAFDDVCEIAGTSLDVDAIAARLQINDRAITKRAHLSACKAE
jgi:hypothetical protein